jgi:hypothetical protein
MLHITAPQLISSQCHNCNSTSTDHDWTTSHDAAFLQSTFSLTDTAASASAILLQQSTSGVKICLVPLHCITSVLHFCVAALALVVTCKGTRAGVGIMVRNLSQFLLLNLWSASDELAQHPANIITGVQRAIQHQGHDQCGRHDAPKGHTHRLQPACMASYYTGALAVCATIPVQGHDIQRTPTVAPKTPNCAWSKQCHSTKLTSILSRPTLHVQQTNTQILRDNAYSNTVRLTHGRCAGCLASAHWCVLPWLAAAAPKACIVQLPDCAHLDDIKGANVFCIQHLALLEKG